MDTCNEEWKKVLGENAKFNTERPNKDEQVANVALSYAVTNNHQMRVYQQIYRDGLRQVRNRLIREVPQGAIMDLSYDAPKTFEDLSLIYTDLNNLIKDYEKELAKQGGK
jgi:hypothetical protein